MSTTEFISHRHPFRHRLMLTMGPALFIAMILIGVFAWIFFYGWLTYSAQATLDLEIIEVAQQVVKQDGSLQPEDYYWSEPHHRYDTRHIDPFFLQVFNKEGFLVRASDNIGLFAPGAYPGTLLPYSQPQQFSFERMRMFEIGNRQLYYRTSPIYDDLEQLAGYVQVARYDPGISSIMQRTAWIVVSALVPILLALLGLVWWSAKRVVAPLEGITREAQTLSPSNLGNRILIPEFADKETALLAETLNRQLGQLENAFGEMQRFTADAAHELRTPLTILLGHVSVALRRDRTKEEYKETLHVLHDQVQDLIRLSQSLLWLARLEENKYKRSTELTNLIPILHEGVDPFRARAEEKGIVFTSYFPDEPLLFGYTDLVKEIVINLCDNAVKYTQSGTITLNVRADNERIHLSISDTGFGMSADVLQRATERFYRPPSSSTSKIPGSGLGLAIVDAFTRKMGGTLHMESREGAGTTITVSLPRSR